MTMYWYVCSFTNIVVTNIPEFLPDCNCILLSIPVKVVFDEHECPVDEVAQVVKQL